MPDESLFLNENFLLKTPLGQELFHTYAKEAPIFDFHCHLPVQEISNNHPFSDIAQLWLGGDHYKWRLMRANGIDEALITGAASNSDKFIAWATTLPYAIGNPVYVWSHLELKRIFGLSVQPLTAKNALATYQTCNSKLASFPLRVSDIFRQFHVKMVCTTDDPADDLGYHKKLLEYPIAPTTVVPTFRPDQAFNVGDRRTFLHWLDLLGAACDVEITSYWRLIECLGHRAEFFHVIGCRMADHGLEIPVFQKSSEGEIEGIFSALLQGHSPKAQELEQYWTRLLLDLAKIYFTLGWAMQLHYGAIRNVNAAMFANLGKDAGYDIIGDALPSRPLAAFFNQLYSEGKCPKTVLYCLNPTDYDMLAGLIGAFQQGPLPGRIQLGAAWWFNDHTGGITKQLSALANNGLLGRFIGMLTDSRSFLSYPRHEYFRRILCDLLGSWAEMGVITDDIVALGEIVQNICYTNAKNYFQISLGELHE